MKDVADLTVDDLNHSGCVRLMINILAEAVLRKDLEWLRSDACLRLLEFIPERMLPQVTHRDEHYVYDRAADIEALRDNLVKRVETEPKIRFKRDRNDHGPRNIDEEEEEAWF